MTISTQRKAEIQTNVREWTEREAGLPVHEQDSIIAARDHQWESWPDEEHGYAVDCFAAQTAEEGILSAPYFPDAESQEPDYDSTPWPRR